MFVPQQRSFNFSELKNNYPDANTHTNTPVSSGDVQLVRHFVPNSQTKNKRETERTGEKRSRKIHFICLHDTDIFAVETFIPTNRWTPRPCA